jgi:hypothetical protein
VQNLNIYVPEVVLHFAFRALPAGANSQRSVNALGWVKRPIINDFWVLLLCFEFLTVHKELDVWELDGHGIVMPFIVADLKQIFFE